MKFRLKDQSISIQIWFILGVVLVSSFLLLSISLPFVLGRSFTNEFYARLEESQESMLEIMDKTDFDQTSLIERYMLRKPIDPNYMISKKKVGPNYRVVRHAYFESDTNLLIPELPSELVEMIAQDAILQKEVQKRYFGEYKEIRILYIIHKVEKDGKQGYLISYLWERYRTDLVKFTLTRLLVIIIFVLLISWIASIFIARRLTKPIISLEQQVKEIAQHRWDEPLILDRNDEIGNLGSTIEWMRCQLVEQNQKQQVFLQNVSHELKTPIMIIRSYVHSIQDGIYPGGNLEASLEDIESETKRLEQRVRSLLHVSKLEYLATHHLEETEFNLTEMLKRIVERFNWKRTEINWDLELEELIIRGDEEKLGVVLENLFDNQIRYARKLIKIDLAKRLSDGQSSILLRVWNDGPQIEDEVMAHLFGEFKKGNQGDFGLGLAIVKRIIDMHHGLIWVANEEGGVAFYIRLFQASE